MAGAQQQRPVLGHLPLIVPAALAAALRMGNLATVRGERGAMREVLGDAHGWVMSLLHIGTSGSFIGFGFAFGQVLQVQFHQQFDTRERSGPSGEYWSTWPSGSPSCGRTTTGPRTWRSSAATACAWC
ncbi:hypothetical protein ACFYW1_25820 [Streptomyces sp. NPDC002669]|uniref:hypothetical protein n=1 Tax=Streptomyces sp. NPDC002669 TaxID=3364658 RepID=UPI00368421B8